jgi:hypothetical protein
MPPIKIVPINLSSNGVAFAQIGTFLTHVAIVVMGLRYCFNQKKDAQTFVPRFVCFSLPVAVKISLYIFVITFLAIVLLPASFVDIGASRGGAIWIMGFVAMFIEAVFFYYMGSALSRAANNGT